MDETITVEPISKTHCEKMKRMNELLIYLTTPTCLNLLDILLSLVEEVYIIN